MKNVTLKQQIISGAFRWLPDRIFARISGQSLIVAYYHMVSDNQMPHLEYLYNFKSIESFKKDIEFIVKNYTAITLTDLLDFIKNGHRLPQKPVLLTFDDGFKEMYEIVAPILLEKGVSATFFINSDFLDNKELCFQHKASLLSERIERHTPSFNTIKKISNTIDEKTHRSEKLIQDILSIGYGNRETIDQIAQLLDVDFGIYLHKNKPYLTSDQVRKLISWGFSIGAHSIDHPLYSSLDLMDQLHQTIQSVLFLRNRFDLRYGAFAFPHGDNNVSLKFFREVEKSGIVDIFFGTGGMIKDTVKKNIQRISFENPILPAKSIITIAYAKSLWRQILKKNSIYRD